MRGLCPPQHVIDEVKKQGGSIWLAHPHWSGINILRDTMPLTGLAGIEVFNTTCRCAGRGESSVHWDDWMDLSGQLLPALGNDDSHAAESEERDTYQGWTMVRVKERSPEAIVEALESGAGYASTGPQIFDIQLHSGEDRAVEATVKCSPAQRIAAVLDSRGTEYHEGGKLFEAAIFKLRPGSKHVRFEIIAPNGDKAWSNPFDLTAALVGGGLSDCVGREFLRIGAGYAHAIGNYFSGNSTRWQVIRRCGCL